MGVSIRGGCYGYGNSGRRDIGESRSPSCLAEMARKVGEREIVFAVSVSGYPSNSPARWADVLFRTCCQCQLGTGVASALFFFTFGRLHISEVGSAHWALAEQGSGFTDGRANAGEKCLIILGAVSGAVICQRSDEKTYTGMLSSNANANVFKL